MRAYLLSQISPSLMWVQAAAYGTAWFGYDRSSLESTATVKQILRMHTADKNDFAIELWQRGQQSEFTLHGNDYQNVLDELNSIMSEVKS